MQQRRLWPTEEQGGDALIEGPYRYWLRRWWEPENNTLLWVLLNPSVADAHRSDPTVRRVIAFSRREGYSCVEITNLFAWRATNPAELKNIQAAQAIGPDNDAYLRAAAARADQIVLAWGVHGGLYGRDQAVLGLLSKVATCPVVCLGMTMSQTPRHPLYLRADTLLHPFSLEQTRCG